MRLGQLARKLAIRPAEIVEFLAVNHIEVNEGSNTRLEDDHVGLIMKKFATSMTEYFSEESSHSEKEIEMAEPLESTLIEAVTPVNEATDVTIEKNTTVTEVPLPHIETKEEGIDIIKAPKVTLSGLKVLGKVELPEPKKKEHGPIVAVESPTDDIPVTEAKQKPRQEERKPYIQKQERQDQRPRKNPIALQRELKSEEAEKKRITEAKRQKEQRTQNYLKKVKVSPPTKSMRLINEPVMEISELEDTPKTWWGRFIKWLTTA